ncbi:hypothetical protein O0L34_g3168 [Tuta absoluta]|nr:hypothetical protein O0L34_g3168 [Tuta absoluta]
MSAWWSFVVAVALSAGAAFSSNELPAMRYVDQEAGRNVLTEVRTDFDKVHGCYLVPPKGEVVQLMPEDLSGDKYRLESPVTLRGCRVTIIHVEREDAGVWQLYYTTADGLKKASQFYNLSVQGGEFASDEITQEDDEHLTPMTTVDEYVGRNLLTEVRTDFDQVHGCYLVPPKGEVVQLMPEDLSGDKYRLESPVTLRGCRVTIMHVEREDAGVWQLYYTTADGVKKASQYYNVTVRSQESITTSTPLTDVNVPTTSFPDVEESITMSTHIPDVHVPSTSFPNVEDQTSLPDVEVESVNALPSVIAVSEGSDVHVRLEEATPQHDTCVLRGPATSTAQLRRDSRYVHTCGFVVTNVTIADAGIWVIEYGTHIKYEASILVNVHERFSSVEVELVWTKNLPLNVSIGPEDAVYCKIVNPSGFVVSEGFGPCSIVLDRVRPEHAGVWKAAIGTVGRVLVEDHHFIVRVKTALKTQVSTSVVAEKPWVMLSCRVKSEHEISACKFRDPTGKVLLVSPGVGEDRYSFHGTPVDLYSEVGTHQCGVRITNPVAEDQGLWRCAVVTQQDTYYGFLNVFVPWILSDPVVAETVVTEPTLSSEFESVSAVEGEQVTLRCSVQSAIRYCYFRAQNGTVFNVSPGSSDWFEYYGAGLEAGECGIKFPAVQRADSGAWSCHVGLHNHSQQEQRAQVHLHIQAEMSAEMTRDVSGVVVVRGQVMNQRALEYCRFVRIDGAGFTSENVPPGYENHSALSRGHCEVRVPDANMLERHPWTVVAKIVGQDSELARSTAHTFAEPEANPPSPEQTEHPIYVRPKRSDFAALWSFILVVSLSMLLVGLMLGPRRNREWTTGRAAIIRRSFRTRNDKNHLPQTTPMPA